MPTIDIPDKICPHCGGTKWYKFNVKTKSSREIVYRCVKRVLDTNKKSNRDSISAKKALDKYRKTDKFKLVQNAYYISNKEKIIERTKEWRSKNKTRYNKSVNNSKKIYGDNLTDYYIKQLLTKRQPELSYSDIPQELIDLKRKELLLKRKIKNNG
jgi:hypothetical protein